MKMNAWMTFRGELLVLGSVSYNPTPNATKTSRIVRLKEHYVGPLWKENPCVVCIWYSSETPMKIEDHLLDSDMSNNPANYTIFLVKRGRKKTIYGLEFGMIHPFSRFYFCVGWLLQISRNDSHCWMNWDQHIESMLNAYVQKLFQPLWIHATKIHM